MNQCQAGHSDHDSFKIETSIGFMLVYNYERYKNVAGYCSGKDDVSRTLINTGAWEKPETEIIKKVLEDGDKNNYFWDLGCHIGWYTIIAAKLGYRVLAKRVNNLFIEFSPVFNNSYPEIYNKLTKVGYKAFIDGAPFNGDMNFNQANILFRL